MLQSKCHIYSFLKTYRFEKCENTLAARLRFIFAIILLLSLSEFGMTHFTFTSFKRCWPPFMSFFGVTFLLRSSYFRIRTERFLSLLLHRYKGSSVSGSSVSVDCQQYSIIVLDLVFLQNYISVVFLLGSSEMHFFGAEPANFPAKGCRLKHSLLCVSF